PETSRTIWRARLDVLRRGLWRLRSELRVWFVAQKQRGPVEYRPRPVGPGDKTGLFWLLNALIPMVVIALPSTPIFGGTKHWMPAWPFWALMAGIAFERAMVYAQKRTALQQAWRISLASTGLAVFLLLPGAIGLWRSHPHGLAYYNTLIGGPRGSANWKMQRSFWASTMRQALPWMNTEMKRTQPRTFVHFHDTTGDAFRMYRQDGMMHPHINARWHPHPPVDWIAFIHQKWLRNQLYHSLYLLKAVRPVYGVYLDDVPLLTFWRRTSAQKAPLGAR
ncbi:MAG: hypothetical protein AAGJ35_15000, partial [Myxococcota bacterium]